ncbi:MAG: hypothetical protein Ct9H300mP4_00820 [Gammaproteobacteria bacterium]|nr:MAG: hypothetical protein Ct9H300mP4_00820 [Gammaproteobacteria bacterium]
MPTIVGKYEDTILKVYWELMHEMRDKGWQINNKKWQELIADGNIALFHLLPEKTIQKAGNTLLYRD